jgi:filamin
VFYITCLMSQIEAYGPGLQPTGIVVNTVTEFTVDASKAGSLPSGELPKVVITDASSVQVKADIVDNKNSTFTVRYTPTRAVIYTITVTYSGTAVQKSPYKVIIRIVQRKTSPFSVISI